MVVSTEYSIGDIVYLKTDTDQDPRMITSVQILADNFCQYRLSLGSNVSWHTSIEISKEKSVLGIDNLQNINKRSSDEDS